MTQPVLIYRLSSGMLSVTRGPSTNGNALAEEMVHKNALRAVWPQNPDHYVDATQLSRAVSSSYRNQMSLAALGAVALEERRKPGRKLLLWVGPGVGVGTGARPDVPYVRDSNGGLPPSVADQINAKGTFDAFSKICWFSTVLRQAVFPSMCCL